MDLRANECAAYLAGHDGYLLISHRRPDGDTLGSGAALCCIYELDDRITKWYVWSSKNTSRIIIRSYDRC